MRRTWEIAKLNRQSMTTAESISAGATSENNRLAARLASLVCPAYSAPPSHRLLNYASGCAVQGLALRVTRLYCRGHDAVANRSFCNARV
jgi:hypothetical protein